MYFCYEVNFSSIGNKVLNFELLLSLSGANVGKNNLTTKFFLKKMIAEPSYGRCIAPFGFM